MIKAGKCHETILWISVGVQLETCNIHFKPAVLLLEPWGPPILDDCVMASHIEKTVTATTADSRMSGRGDCLQFGGKD